MTAPDAPLEFYATAAPGTEAVLRDELRDLGFRSARLNSGGIPFFGAMEDGWRACLHSRIAQRIMLVLGRYPARTLDELYQGAEALPWEQYLAPAQSIACGAFAHPSCGENPDFVAVRLKDAIVDRQRRLFHGERSTVSRTDPDLRAFVYWGRERATVYLDLSGAPLFKRGYRVAGGEAPLKETLAAAILRMTDWDGKAPLLDPMCGSGTLLIEGAMWAANIAPGIFRQRFGFERWSCFRAVQADRMRELRGEARRRATGQLPKITGCDLDASVLELAEANARGAGLAGKISFRPIRLRELQGDGQRRLVVTNPPYGIRLDGDNRLYQEFGNAIARMKNCRVAVLAGSPRCLSCIPLRPVERHPLKNGNIDCQLTIYEA
ncbi:MAG: class I SAM-dependent RNA methyltransferase [Oligosphaeraceae bacterium]